MGKKILVVDDETDILMILEDRLLMEGFDVVTASDGSTGVSMAESESPDIILLDVMLPDMSGFDVCRAIREKGVKARIIMETSKIDAIDAVEARRAGADDFTVKTGDFKELFRALEQFK